MKVYVYADSFSSLYKGLDFNLLPYMKKMFYISHVFGLFLIKIIIIIIIIIAPICEQLPALGKKVTQSRPLCCFPQTAMGGR